MSAPRSSKTTTLSAAAGCVSRPVRNSRTSYTIYGPYRDSAWDGARTEIHVEGYMKAINLRRRWVARIALFMMGETAAADWIGADEGTAAAQVSRALDRSQRHD